MSRLLRDKCSCMEKPTIFSSNNLEMITGIEIFKFVLSFKT
jgi:hypothetical protein